jgi:hypothetical protein
MDIPAEARERILDEEHLRLLSIGHYIHGGLVVAFASVFIFHFVFLTAMAANPQWFAPHGQAPVPMDPVLRIFAVIVGVMILVGWTLGGLTIYSGRCMRRRAHRTFTIVMAAANTLLIPFGTVLGVFTLIVITRPSVTRLYGAAQQYKID